MNERSLKVFVANVRDLKSDTKLEELQLLAEGFGFDVVAITESWANSSIDYAEVALEGNIFQSQIIFHSQTQRQSI